MKHDWEKRPFGARMDVAAMVAAQTRIERQDAPHAASASFDFAAANAFQSYVSSAIAFSIKRGGILYGTGGCGCGLRQRAVPQGEPDAIRPAVRCPCPVSLLNCWPSLLLLPLLLQWTRRALCL